MKIIAKTNAGFLLEADKNEVANLIGYYYADSDSKVERMEIGQVIAVAAMYKHLYALHHAKRKLAQMQKDLIEAANTLGTVEPLIPNVEPKPGA